MKSLTESQLAAERAVTLLGGPVKAAIALSVPGSRYQTVQSWLRHRVPAEYCPVIERETRRRAALDPAVIPVLCEELRPDVAWDVLRAQAAALDPAEVVFAQDRRAGDRRSLGDRRASSAERRGFGSGDTDVRSK